MSEIAILYSALVELEHAYKAARQMFRVQSGLVTAHPDPEVRRCMRQQLKQRAQAEEELYLKCKIDLGKAILGVKCADKDRTYHAPMDALLQVVQMERWVIQNKRKI